MFFRRRILPKEVERAKATGNNGIFPFKKEAASGKISRVPEAAFTSSKL
ncbi:hypothetical protein B4135_1561 [Caldibacillus debilis]|uniref:Uncharacterized protein n=1 Tax=Caldibacillus debilis TaxID=301148 RepID=A0A150MC71_9BACI|nr:hypothetical protein B4135_1561 [Caldibacillus debilis]